MKIVLIEGQFCHISLDTFNKSSDGITNVSVHYHIYSH